MSAKNIRVAKYPIKIRPKNAFECGKHENPTNSTVKFTKSDKFDCRVYKIRQIRLVNVVRKYEILQIRHFLSSLSSSPIGKSF